MESTGRRNVSSAAAIVMAALVVSRITGFFRQMLVPSVLGSNNVGDAYEFAFKITDLMFYLLVGGAISAAIIPVLTGYIAKKDEEDGWKAVSTLINTIFSAMVIFIIIGIIFAHKIIPLLALGYSMETDSEQLMLIIRLSRILLPSVGILMLAGMANGVLNSYHRFAAAAFGPSIYNILCSLSILFLSRISVESVAVGVMCSSFLYFLLQLTFALKNLRFYKFKYYFKHPGFKRILRLAIPSLISSSVAQINTFITSMFTTLFPPGSIVALLMTDKIWQTPYGIFAQGMGTAMLPTMSESHAEGDKRDYREVFLKGLKTVLLLIIPSAAGLIVLREPLITFFRFSEKFDIISMQASQRILVFYSIALLAQSAVTILMRAFYAANDTKTPLYTGASTILVNISLSYVLYKYTTIGVSGMALAYSAAALLNASLMMFLIKRKNREIDMKGLFVFLVKTFAAAAIMFAFIFLINELFGNGSLAVDFSGTTASIIKTKIMQFALLIIRVTIGVVLFSGLVFLFKIEEGIYVFKMVNEKVRKIAGKLVGVKKKKSKFENIKE